MVQVGPIHADLRPAQHGACGSLREPPAPFFRPNKFGLTRQLHFSANRKGQQAGGGLHQLTGRTTHPKAAMGGGGTEGFAYTKEQVSQLAQYPFERA